MIPRARWPYAKNRGLQTCSRLHTLPLSLAAVPEHCHWNLGLCNGRFPFSSNIPRLTLVDSINYDSYHLAKKQFPFPQANVADVIWSAQLGTVSDV